MPKGIPLTGEEQDNRRHQIFNASVSLFLQKGFQETSMREIAEAAGMGKSSLYDYFRTKDEILLFVLEEETLILIQQAQKIAGMKLPPEERLGRIMQVHLDFMQANQNLFGRLVTEAQRLKSGSLKRLRETRYAYQDLVRGVIDEGISCGSFRQVDSLLTARLIINSLLSILFTSRPTGDVKEMLDETMEIFFNGIRR